VVFDFTILSGTIGTVTVNGQIPDYINIFARTPNYSSDYNGLTNGSTWQIPIPSGFTGTLNIGVSVEHAGEWYEKGNIITWTSGSSSTDNISLGNVAIDFTTLSGTIGTVTVNGQIPDYINIFAHASYDAWWGTVTGNAWQISIPADLSGTLIIAVEVDHDGDWYQKEVYSWTSDSAATGISLGNVSVTLTSIGGTVTTNGTNPLSGGYLLVYGQPVTAVSELYDRIPLGQAEITNGSFAGQVEGTSGYVVITDMETFARITGSAVTLGTTMNLNISAMTSLTIDVPLN
jgi:hypothetical protein